MDINKITSTYDIWELFKWASGILISFLVISSRSIKVFFRLGKNLGQNVLIFCPNGHKTEDGSSKNMEREKKVLKNSGYFKISEVITNFHSIDTKDVENAGVVILGYDRDMTNFDEFVDMVKNADKPLIIYTFDLGYQLTEEHRKKIKSYKWYALSSMPLRLVSDLFAIMSSYKHE